MRISLNHRSYRGLSNTSSRSLRAFEHRKQKNITEKKGAPIKDSVEALSCMS